MAARQTIRVRATEIDVLRAIDSADRRGQWAAASSAWVAMMSLPLAGTTPAPQTIGGFVARVRRLVGKGLVTEPVVHGFALTESGRAALADFHGEVSS